jgi:hypothetical protein
MRLAFAALIALTVVPGLAVAQTTPVAASRVHPQAEQYCRADCLAAAAERPGQSREGAAQQCNVRCSAVAMYLTIQAQRGNQAATGRGVVTAALGGAAPQNATYGVIYAARTPSAGHGMVVGEADRLLAHRVAETACRAGGGQGCRAVAEFTEACGAAAQGITRSGGALFITDDPRTFVVTSYSGAGGASRAAAEGAALAECRSRDAGASCRIVASTCASARG